jgi:hypothetical protein
MQSHRMSGHSGEARAALFDVEEKKVSLREGPLMPRSRMNGAPGYLSLDKREMQGALTPGGHHGAFGRTFVACWTLRVRETDRKKYH